MQTDFPEVRIHRLPYVSALTGQSPAQIARLERAGLFPRRIKLSERSSGWRSDEIQNWISERTAASRTPEAQAKAHENPVKRTAATSGQAPRRGRPPKSAASVRG